MTITAPENVSYGRITGQFIFDVRDGGDPGTKPDFKAMTGTVTFTPSVGKVLDAGARVIIGRAPIVCPLDVEGFLCTPLEDEPLVPAYRGVELIATDDPDLNPQGWTWTVSYDLRANGKTLRGWDSHELAVLSESEQDLVDLIPPDAAKAIGIPQANALAAAAAADAAAAQESADAAQAAAEEAAGALVDSASFVRTTAAAAVADPADPLGVAAKIGTGLATFSLGNATADDTARINAALTACRVAGGGTVYGKPGEDYKISSTLIVGANTTLDLRASDLTLLVGSNCQMISNYSDRTPVGTATDAAVTSGSAVVTTSLAAVAAVGMTAYIDGAGSNGYGELIGLVNAVDTTAGTITLAKLHGTTIPANASATVTGAKIQLSNVDADVHIKIRNAKRGANGPDAGTPRGSAIGGHSIFLRGVRQYSVDVRRATSTAGVSFIWPTNAAHGVVRLWDADVHRTGVQVVGPIFDLRLYCRGRCTDDLVNLCGNVYPDQTNTSGDVIGVTIEDIINSGTTNGSALKINPCQGNVVDGVVVEGRIGGVRNGGTASRVTIMEDTVEPETAGGVCGSIDLGVIDFPASSSAVLGFGTVAIRSLKAHVICRTIHPIRVLPQAAAPLIESVDLTLDFLGENGDGIQLFGFTNISTLTLRPKSFVPINDRPFMKLNSADARIGHLIIDTPHLHPGRALPSGMIALMAGTIDRLTIREPDIKWVDASNGNNVVMLTGATVGDLIVNGGRIVNGDAVIRANSGSLRRVVFSGGFTQEGGQRLLHTALNSEVVPTDVRRLNCTQGALFPQSSSVALAVQGGDFIATGTSNVLISTNGSGSTVDGHRLPVDVSLINPKVGAIVRNTNAALAVGVGPAIYDGTSWRRVSGTANRGFVSLAGGTATVADTAITATSVIRLSSRQLSGTPGAVFVSAKTAGTGFTITSTNAADTSSIYWEVLAY
jgi:hypothetical protein